MSDTLMSVSEFHPPDQHTLADDHAFRMWLVLALQRLALGQSELSKRQIELTDYQRIANGRVGKVETRLDSVERDVNTLSVEEAHATSKATSVEHRVAAVEKTVSTVTVDQTRTGDRVGFMVKIAMVGLGAIIAATIGAIATFIFRGGLVR